MNSCDVKFLVTLVVVAVSLQTTTALRFMNAVPTTFFPAGVAGPVLPAKWIHAPQVQDGIRLSTRAEHFLVDEYPPTNERRVKQVPVRRGPLGDCESHSACRERLLTYFNGIMKMNKAGR